MDDDLQGLQHELELEREQAAVEALERLRDAGAPAEDLEFLAGEIGIRALWKQWRAGA